MNQTDMLSNTQAVAALCEAHATLRIAADISERLFQESAGGAGLHRQRRALEDEAIALIDRGIDEVEAMPGLLVSLSPRIVGHLPPAPDGDHEMSDRFWIAGLPLMTGDELALYLSRGVGIHPHQDLIFAEIDRIAARDSARADALVASILGAITEDRPLAMTETDFSSSDPATGAIRSPRWAPVLERLAASFPDDFAFKLAGALDRGEIDQALKLHLAGVPLGRIRPETLGSREGRRLAERMTSHHGRLAILARTGDLATYLSRDLIETIEAFEEAAC